MDHLPSCLIHTKIIPWASQVASFWYGSFQRTNTTWKHRINKLFQYQSIFILLITLSLINASPQLFVIKTGLTRAGVYKKLCPQHMLAPKDNLETRCQNRNRGIIQSNINRNLPKVNQVIYTLETICVPNILILAHMVLQIFCWQGSIGLQCISQKREMIQPNIYRILPKC